MKIKHTMMNLLALLFSGLVMAGVAGAADNEARATYAECYQAIDAQRIKSRIADIWKHEFQQTLPAKRRAAEQVAAFMREDGFKNVELIEIPVDGHTSFQDKKMPIGWDATVGKLTITDYGNPDEIVEFASPEQRVGPVVADYQAHPFHLIKGSVATPPGGIDAEVVTEAAFRRGEKVRGKFVVLEPLTWPRYNVLGKLIDAGVAGFITDFLTGRFSTPDCLQWVTACTETHSWSPDEDTRPFLGFSVTPRVGTYLRTYANRGGLKVHAECDGRRYASTVPFITATIPGRRPEEYWLIAHMYEPLATDDSNGVAAVLEIARMFLKGPQPEYTLRVGFGIEMYGYAAYTSMRGTPLKGVLGGLNCDSVISAREHSIRLALSGTPSWTSTIADSTLADLVGAPNAPEMQLDVPRTFDDDQFISDPTVGVPIDWPLRRTSGDKYWHNSVQSLEIVDPERIRQGTAFAATVAKLALNPTAATLTRSARQAEVNLRQLADQARNAEEFAHLSAFERRRLADFGRVLPAAAVEAALATFDRQAAALASTLRNRAVPIATSPMREAAERLVPRKTCVGFPQDLVRVPKAERVDLIGEYIYGPLVNIGINADGKKTLARLIREAEYERGFEADEATVRKIIDDIRFLAKWSYFSLAEVAPKWICGGYQYDLNRAPVLEKRWVVDSVPAQASLRLAVQGWAEISVNGRRVDDTVMAPVTGQPSLRTSQLIRDLRPYLKPGTNVVSVLLGNGWHCCKTKEVWGFATATWHIAPMNAPPAIRGELTADGQVVFVTDSSWTAYDSPIVFNQLRNGEWYDARLEGMREHERSATVKFYEPLVAISPEDAAPCRQFAPLNPVRSFPAKGGGIFYDFGSNRAGWCEIEVVGAAGAKVIIDYDELLTADNDLCGHVNLFMRRAQEPHPSQHDEYTLAGRREGEKWHPRFTYHGFRYARVRTEGPVELKAIRSVFVHSDFAARGMLTISDPVFQKLQSAACNSFLSNFVGIPTDCPHREKNGWTGDHNLACETGFWNFDAKAGYEHFLRMMFDSQRSDGSVPCIMPWTEYFGFLWGSGPAWDGVLFQLPRQIYRFYSDDSLAREAYPAMKKYLKFINAKARADGLVEYGLGDWCYPKQLMEMPPLLLTDSAYVWWFHREAAEWARRFGEPDFAAECLAKAESIKAAFNREFYRGGGVYADDQLTSLAAPLYFRGLCQDGEEPKVAARLAQRSRELKHQAYFGIQGAKWVPRVLADYGYLDDAYRFFVQPELPGWAAWVANGEDTLWEAWFNNDRDGSHNHIMFGDFSAWAYEYLAGIKIAAPGFADYAVKPYLPAGVDSFDISYQSPRGEIRVIARRDAAGQPVYDIRRPEAENLALANGTRISARRLNGKVTVER